MATAHRQHPPTLSRGYILCHLIRTTFIITVSDLASSSSYISTGNSSRAELEPESPVAEGGTGVKDWLKQQPGRSISSNITQQLFMLLLLQLEY